MRRTLLPLLLCLPIGACAIHTKSSDASLGAYPELQKALNDFQAQQGQFLAQNPIPQVFDFADAGRVTIRDISLDGYPGSAYVRARFLYQNTTGRPVNRAWVSLDVLDAEDRLVASQVSVVIVWAAPMPIASNSFYADELRTRTRDAHLQPGWKWRVSCVAEFEDPADAGVNATRPPDPPAIQRAKLPVRIGWDW